MRPYGQSPPVVVVPKARPENVTESAGRCPMRTLAVAAALFLLLAGCGGDDKPTAESTSKATSTSQATTATPQRVSIRGHLYFTRTIAGDVQTVFAASGLQERQLTEPGEACCILRKSPTQGRLLVMPGGDIEPPITGGTIHLNGGNFTRLSSPTPPSTWCHRPGPRRGRGSPSRGGTTPIRAGPASTPRAPRKEPTSSASPTGQDSSTTSRSTTHRTARSLSSTAPCTPTPTRTPTARCGSSTWTVPGAHRVTTAESPPADWARWSPDATRILFASERLSPTGPIWTVSPTGTGLTKLVSRQERRLRHRPRVVC